ncbi:type I polyketide synthase, partial [Sphingomonas sp. CCH16-B10]
MTSSRQEGVTSCRQDEALVGDAAIVGIGCRLPGADTTNGFWRLLLTGEDVIRSFPAERADWMRQLWCAPGVPDLAACPGAYLDEVDKFDCGFFGISPAEAELMDPQQRLLLETSWHALEDARIPPSRLAGTKTGVYVGVCNTDYAEVLDAVAPPADLYVTTGSFASMLANRLSFFLDLTGPSVCVDTSCSSSLVAVHAAVQALRRGECETALVAGVNLCLTPKRFESFRAGGMLSPDGRCKTFDAGANGYVRGEGVITLVLKRLDQATADGSRIYGVIRGSAVGHGGRTRGLTVTDPRQQARLIADACRDAGVYPSSLDYVELHGTGTALGDPIEFLGLKLAFQDEAARDPIAGDAAAACALGSVKARIGHLEAAAGVAGLTKVALALRHRLIPASPHLRSLNPLVKLDGTPFRIPTHPEKWERKASANGVAPRRAGVSSFGFGGAYAHVVIEEGPVETRTDHQSQSPAIVFVSAKDEAGLRRQAGVLARYLEREDDVELAALAHELQFGREAMEHRLAFPAERRDEAIRILSIVAA